MATLEALRQKREQIDAQIAKKNALARTKQRKDDTRRKILVGAIVLEAIKTDKDLAQWWELQFAKMARPKDRELFTIEPADDVHTEPTKEAKLTSNEPLSSPAASPTSVVSSLSPSVDALPQAHGSQDRKRNFGVDRLRSRQ